jgi:hypothetical protein
LTTIDKRTVNLADWCYFGRRSGEKRFVSVSQIFEVQCTARNFISQVARYLDHCIACDTH